MSSTARQSPLKINAITAGICTNGIAVATAEPSAAFVSFQRQAGRLTPTQNEHSASRSLTTAAQFSGNNAISAANAAKTATHVTFLA